MQNDYYETLGVSRTATAEEINKAYREKALEFHPDRNSSPEAADRFKEASKAFEVLSNADKRREYDQFGTVRGPASGPGPGGPAGFHIDPFEAFGFGDLFRDHFGGRQHGTKGADILKEVRVNLREAYHGCEKWVDCGSHSSCSECGGSGAQSWESCPACGGSGRLNVQKGPFSISSTCTRCHGNGRFPKVQCPRCHGAGQVAGKTRQHKLEIPPGIESGVQIIIKGEGGHATNGVPGDVICQVIVEPHAFYEREGPNLYCVIPVTFAQSVLGHEVEIPVFERSCKVRIPAGTKSGQVLRVKNMGMPILVTSHRQKSQIGDLLIRAQVESPQKPSGEYLDLIKKMAAIDDKEQYEAIDRFEKQIKEMKDG